MVKASFWIFIAVLQLCAVAVFSKTICPKLCECDFHDGLKRARCTNRNIVDVNLGVPENVEVYDLSQNSLQKIEDNAFLNLKFKYLVNLNFSHNTIFWIGLHAFAGLENLKVLDMSSNRIQALPSDLFWYNNKLEKLDLSRNKFLRISNKPFLSHNNLKILDLSQSQISYLPAKTFQELPSLSNLDVSNNNVIELKIEVFSSLKKLSKMNILNNQIHCNKEFEQFQQWLQQKNIVFERQCKSNNIKGNMFEKMIMISSDPPVEKEVDLDELWNVEIETPAEANVTITNTTEPEDSFLDLFTRRMSPIYSLIIGFEVGLVLGVFGTYCCMSYSLKCKNIKFRNRRNTMRLRRMEWNEARNRLLGSTTIYENFVTPPAVRRQLSAPQSTCRSISWEPRGFQFNTTPRNTGATTMVTTCPDTPPPAYNQALHDRILRSSQSLSPSD